MSKSKSLGSSPIGYSSLGVNSFEFIPSIKNSPGDREKKSDASIGFENSKPADITGSFKSDDDKIEKKIVSYYLEEHLIERLKKAADKQKMYYSSIVSEAIFCWLENNDWE